MVSVPEGFQLNPKIRRQLDRKREVFEKGEGLDWGMGEQLAFGTLFLEGTPVRLSGQDSKRGTFSHRHAVYYDVETRERYVPLLDIEEGQAQFCVYNSSLSEAGMVSALILATHKTILKCWPSGRRSSAILLTVRKL